jgi:prepilin-type N-terminal cleavage/methylation domain-containing protein
MLILNNRFWHTKILKSARPIKTPDAGFTLLQVLVTVVIIGILGAIAAPSWLQFRNTRILNIAQSQVYQAMRQAQSEAKRTRTVWQVSFRESNNVVQWATHPANATPTADSWQSLPTNARINAQETTLTQAGGVYQLQFNHEGEVNGALGRFTLSTPNSNKALRCVFASSLLGAIRRGSEQSVPDQSGKLCY